MYPCSNPGIPSRMGTYKREEKQMDHFKLVSDYQPSGDQPQAIEGLVQGVNLGLREQTLLGLSLIHI